MIDRKPGEVIFEYVHVGNSVRVTAVDAVTGTEIVLQAPANLSAGDMQRLALRKLDYVLKKREKS
jgi:hypothetical protein